MAVKVVNRPALGGSTADSDKLLSLDIDNGDLAKLNEVLEKWNFKDQQSFLRFAVSIMLVTEDKYLAIKVKGEVTAIKPSAEYVKSEQNYNDNNTHR